MALSGARTTSQTIDYVTLVAEAEGEEFPFYEHDAYEFSVKTYRETDAQGVYSGPPYPE